MTRAGKLPRGKQRIPVWHYEGRFGHPLCRGAWSYSVANVTDNLKYVTCAKCKKLLAENQNAV